MKRETLTLADTRANPIGVKNVEAIGEYDLKREQYEDLKNSLWFPYEKNYVVISKYQPCQKNK